MDKSNATGGYFPALIVICVILTLTAILVTLLPRTHALGRGTSAPSESTNGGAYAEEAP